MNKARNLEWFNENMKSKMLKHDENPCEMIYGELIEWLDEEVAEVKEALAIKHREEVIDGRVKEADEEAIKECADVANLAYFIANKIKKEWK